VKAFDSRVYSINDFIEWDRQNSLELNPAFQRRSVWSATAKSYLMDTIIRGKPIPKFFIRQKLNPTTGLPPEKWSSLKYGLWPDGGLSNAKEETQGGRDCREAAAG
jgi:hypothetical protein